MDIGSSVRLSVLPVGGVTPATPLAKTNPIGSGPSEGAFTPNSSLAGVPKEPAKPTPETGDELRRQITLDQDTHRIVYQGIDQLTGEVVFQLPDPRYLKAYVDQQKTAEQQAEKRVPSTSQVA
jgi:hypothetical protein